MGLETPTQTVTINWAAGLDALATAAGVVGAIGLLLVAVHTAWCLIDDTRDFHRRAITATAAAALPLFVVGMFFSESIVRVSA